MQNLEGAKRVNAFFAISSPLNGTHTAKLAWGKGARSMGINSQLLHQLKSSESILAELPLYSYWTPYDMVILPARSSEWILATNRTFNCIWHDWMVSNTGLLAQLLADLQDVEQRL